MLKSLILKNRSYRRFDESFKISREDLLEMVDAARVSASARNAQPLKYLLSWEPELNEKIFPNLGWAGYLKDWPGPEPGERPSAYLVQLNDTEITTQYFCDDGIAAQSILLTAVEMGLGGCIIASVKKEALSEVLELPEHLIIIQVEVASDGPVLPIAAHAVVKKISVKEKSSTGEMKMMFTMFPSEALKT